MRKQLFTRRPGVLGVLVAPGVALLLVGCGGEGGDRTAPEPSGAAGTSATAAAQSPEPGRAATSDESPSTPPSPPDQGLPTDPGADASSQVDEAFGAARVVALQSGLRYVDPALGTPEDIPKADAQCADLERNVANPGKVAARRFSTEDHQVTEADGERINTILRNSYCG